MTSKFIIDQLREKHGKDRLFVAESYVFAEESDFLAFDFRDKTHEFEVKVSKGDFKADFKKKKHNRIKSILDGNLYERHYQHEFEVSCSFSNRYLPDLIPNKLSFIVPFGLIEKKDVPDYAGLYYVTDEGVIHNAKKCKTIHTEEFRHWRDLSLKLHHHIRTGKK